MISLVLLLALAELILPEGSLRPYVRVILGVVLVVGVLRPMVQLGAFQWALPALTVPPPSGQAPVAQGERLAAALQDRARGEAERQAALQAVQLLELRLGVYPEAVKVRLAPEGWVDRIEVVLGEGAGGLPESAQAGGAPGGTGGVSLQMRPVRPVTVTSIQVEEVGAPTAQFKGEPAAAAAWPSPESERARRVRAVLSEFYQVPADRVHVRL